MSCCCCCCIIIIILGLILISGAGLIALKIVFRPVSPEFNLDSASLTRFSADSDNNIVNGIWQFGFTIKNDNKRMAITYDDLQSFVYYQWETLAGAAMSPSFKQEPKSSSAWNVSLSADNTKVLGWAVSAMNAENAEHGGIRFDLQVRAALLYENVPFKLKMYKVIDCGDVDIGIYGDRTTGKLTGEPRKCTVHG